MILTSMFFKNIFYLKILQNKCINLVGVLRKEYIFVVKNIFLPSAVFFYLLWFFFLLLNSSQIKFAFVSPLCPSCSVYMEKSVCLCVRGETANVHCFSSEGACPQNWLNPPLLSSPLPSPLPRARVCVGGETSDPQTQGMGKCLVLSR